MKRLFKLFKQKLSIDLQELISSLIAYWNIQRDNRAIRRAIRRARMKNKMDGKTYYIMRDRLGGINELNNYELKLFKGKGIFANETIERKIQEAIAIVTSNKVTYKQYQQTQLKKES